MKELPTDEDRQLGKALTRARANAGLSRNEAARRSGVAAGTIRNMEYGLRSVKVSVLLKLAHTYETTPDILTGFLPQHQGDMVDRRITALTEELSVLRKERNDLWARLRSVTVGSVKCAEPHWRRKAVTCERKPGHPGDHRSESAGLGWTAERYSSV